MSKNKNQQGKEKAEASKSKPHHAHHKAVKINGKVMDQLMKAAHKGGMTRAEVKGMMIEKTTTQASGLKINLDGFIPTPSKLEKLQEQIAHPTKAKAEDVIVPKKKIKTIEEIFAEANMIFKK